MTSFLCRRELLEELDGFDESIDYGEDADLPMRAREAGFEWGGTGAVIYYSFVSSLTEVFRQGRWYGKSVLNFLRKNPEQFPILLMMFYFFSWPIITLLGLFNSFIFYLAVAQNLGVLFYIIMGLYKSRSLYILLVPLVKSVRAYGEVIGMIESLSTDDIGRD